MIITRKN